MKKKQIEEFIEKVYPHANVTIEYRSASCLNIHSWAAVCDPKHRVIYLNRSVMQKKRYKDNDGCFTKYTILHELGHLATECGQSESEAEFLAHKWGIETADSLNMYDVRDEMVEHMREWGESRWNDGDCLRRYILAYRLAIKDRKWARKYGLI